MIKHLLFVLFLLINQCNNLLSAEYKEEVVVKAKKMQSLTSWSEDHSEFILSFIEINKIDPQHPKQLFLRVPGMWVSRGSGQEHLTSIRSPVLTGPGACGSFLILEDGISIRPSGFCNVNGLIEANIEQSDEVEIIKGPASSHYGGNAMHGLINLISPSLDGLKTVSSNLGPNDYKNLKLTYGKTKDWLINSHLSSSNGFRENSGFDQQKIKFKKAIQVKDWKGSGNLNLTNLNQETAGYIYGKDAFKNDILRKSNPNPEAFRDATSLRINLNLFKFEQDSSYSLSPYFRKTKMNFLQHYLPGTPLEDNDHWSLGLITKKEVKLENRDNILGAQIEIADVNLKQYQPEVLTTSSPFNNAVRPQGLHYNYQVNSKTLALFYGFKENLVNKSIKVFGDARIEHLAYQYKNKMISGNTKEDGRPCNFGGCFYNRPEDRNDKHTEMSFRLGAESLLVESHNFFLQLSSGFRPPQISEVYRLQKEQNSSDLTSEELIMLEGGISLNTKRFSSLLAIYIGEKKNAIFRDANNFIVDNGKTIHKGIEILTNLKINESNLFLISLSFENHKYDFSSQTSLKEDIEKGDYIDTAPRFKGNLVWLSHVNDFLSSEIEIEKMGSYFTDAGNEHEYEGHALVHARLDILFDEKTRLYLRMNNILDKKYAERADYNTFGGDRYFPGLSREMYIGLEYLF